MVGGVSANAEPCVYLAVSGGRGGHEKKKTKKKRRAKKKDIVMAVGAAGPKTLAGRCRDSVARPPSSVYQPSNVVWPSLCEKQNARSSRNMSLRLSLVFSVSFYLAMGKKAKR